MISVEPPAKKLFKTLFYAIIVPFCGEHLEMLEIHALTENLDDLKTRDQALRGYL